MSVEIYLCDYWNKTQCMKQKQNKTKFSRAVSIQHDTNLSQLKEVIDFPRNFEDRGQKEITRLKSPN